MEAIPGYRLSCSATGTSPIYTALIKNSSTLINTTYIATITLNEEGNYTCAVTNKYGTDVKNFHVIFIGENFLSKERFSVSLINKILFGSQLKYRELVFMVFSVKSFYFDLSNETAGDWRLSSQIFALSHSAYPFLTIVYSSGFVIDFVFVIYPQNVKLNVPTNGSMLGEIRFCVATFQHLQNLWNVPRLSLKRCKFGWQELHAFLRNV